MNNRDLFTEAVYHITGNRPAIREIQYKGGGCINTAVLLKSDSGDYFIKYNDQTPPDMFEKEFRGLNLLQQTGLIKVPEPLGCGQIDNISYIIIENIESAARHNDFWSDFGSKLARMHREFSAERYGLDHDNYIGRLPQINATKPDWFDFFINNRLEFQLRLAENNGLIGASFAGKFRAFYKKLPDLLPVEKPAFLHGDLWSGNFMTGSDGKAVLIDPAVYYGHREAEISFTTMFGGFENEFYRGYNETWPLEKKFEERIDIYNLYPSLVHLNLFGTAYLNGIVSVINRYV